MKVTKNNVELWDNGTNIVPEPMAHLERCARVCYQSEGAKKPGESSEDFVKRVLLKNKDIRKNHMSVFEHVALYYKIPILKYMDYNKLIESKYSKTYTYDNYVYVSTNLRVIYELELTDNKELKSYKCECGKYHEKRYTVLITANRGICDEFLRHRNLSFSHESTRYCNYSKDKFDKQLTFILDYVDVNGDVKEVQSGEYDVKTINGNTRLLYKENDVWKPCNKSDIELAYLKVAMDTETYYNFISKFNNANFVRQILLLGISSKLVISGFESDFKELLDIRLNQRCGIVHPSMLKVAKLINEKLCLY